MPYVTNELIDTSKQSRKGTDTNLRKFMPLQKCIKTIKTNPNYTQIQTLKKQTNNNKMKTNRKETLKH